MNLGFGERVYTGGSFIEDDDGWVLQQDTRQGDELSLPQRERAPRFAYQGVQSFGQGVEAITAADMLRDKCDFFVGGLWPCVADVIGHGV